MNDKNASPIVTSPATVRAIVVMIRVSDISKSAEFYADLGFRIGNAVPREGPPYGWVWLYQPEAPDWKTGANLMLTCGESAADTEVKSKVVVFYLYARDMKGMRQKLLAKGIQASEIHYPDYLPEGEFRVYDPDGYMLMIAQAGNETP